MRISDWSSDVCSSDLRIARLVTKRVVDVLESIEIDAGYRRDCRDAAQGSQILEFGFEASPVGQSCQRVMPRQMTGLGLPFGKRHGGTDEANEEDRQDRKSVV